MAIPDDSVGTLARCSVTSHTDTGFGVPGFANPGEP